MYASTKHLIDEFGGYREVAARMGLKATTVHSHMSAGVFPAKWFAAFASLAGEKGKPIPGQELFSFVPLPAPKMSDERGCAA